MKAWSALATAAAALLALAGCNQSGGAANNSASNASSNASGDKDGDGNSAEATGGKDTAGATPASGGTPTLDRTFLVGRWTDRGDCSDVIEFTQDGRFITDGGNAGGLWNLEGDRLTMTGRATATIRITPIDQNTMTVINVDGSLGRSTRC